MKIGVVYAGQQQVFLRCDIEQDATVAEVIEHSGILKMCPSIDLGRQKIGVFGRFVKLDSPVKDGDRIEIYQKITRVLDNDDDDDDD